MLSSSQSLGVLPSSSILRNDVLKPTSLGFMKEMSEEQVIRETELSTIINDNLTVLKTVTLPDHLNLNEVSKLLRKIIKKDTKKDPLHDVAVKLTNYAQNFFEKMELYFDAIYEYDNKVCDRLKSSLLVNTKEYVRSDMPPSYLRSLTLSYLTQCKYFDVFNHRIRHERLKLIGVRNNSVKFKRVCDRHNGWVDSLHSLLDPMIDSRIRLLWYVDLNNCRTVKEAFKIKELRKSNLEDEHFFGSLVDLQIKTEELRKALINMNKESFLVTLDRKDSTVDLLCNVMELMSK